MQSKSLLDKPFGTLPVLGIWANRVHFAIPAGLARLDAVILLLDEICYSYQDDLTENRHHLQSIRPPSIDEFRRYERREIWRIGSFIVFALNLDLTLKRRYKELLSFVRKLQPDVDALSDNLVQRQEGEIERYKYYRNKVFAHTAFGMPKAEDNLSMQATSLSYLETTLSGITPDGIRIGGMSVVVGEQDPPKFEAFTFPEMVSDFGRHFLEWREMFSDLCNILQDLTDDEIKQHIEGVVTITRSVDDADGGAS